MNILVKNCKACNKEFHKYPSDSKKYWSIKMYCSKKCANNTNKNYEQLKGIKRPKYVIELMKATMFKKGFTPWNKNKPNLNMREEKHFNWKGNNVRYSGLHMWVRSKLGTPSECKHCGTTEAKRFEWANKSHEYKRDLTDWIRLCTSCHYHYDHQIA